MLYSVVHLYKMYLGFVFLQWVTLSLGNLEVYVLSRSTNRPGLTFRWAWSKLHFTIETSVSLAQ